MHHNIPTTLDMIVVEKFLPILSYISLHSRKVQQFLIFLKEQLMAGRSTVLNLNMATRILLMVNR